MRLLQPGSVGHTRNAQPITFIIMNHEEYDVLHGNDIFFQQTATTSYSTETSYDVWLLLLKVRSTPTATVLATVKYEKSLRRSYVRNIYSTAVGTPYKENRSDSMHVVPHMQIQQETIQKRP